MRWACLPLPIVILIACGGPSAHGPATPGQMPAGATGTASTAGAASVPGAVGSTAPPVDAPPAPPPLPTFAAPGELFMVVVTGTAARCEAWTIDPERRVLVSKQDARELAFEVTGKTLAFTDLARYRGGELAESGSCSTRLEARETEQAVVLEGAKLYRSAQACGAAVGQHERVALKLDCAIGEDRAPERARQATRAKLEGLLAQGGTLYSIVDGPGGDTCRAVHVSAGKAEHPGWLTGSLEYDVVRDDGVKGTTGLGYEMKRGADKITFLGPGTTWRDGASQAFG